jgi:hypothetical protein
MVEGRAHLGRRASPAGRTAPRARRGWQRKLARAALGAALALPALIALLWYGIHSIPWLGPRLADGARWLFGARAVSWMEDRAYRGEDRYNRWTRRGEAPKAHWDVPGDVPGDVPSGASGGAPAGDDAGAGGASHPVFSPRRVGAMFASVAAKGDGAWVAVPDPERADEAPRMYKTLVHPDSTRAWAELFVVALDARRVRVGAVAGTKEPAASTREGAVYARTGLVPVEDRDELLAAFNGGFKAEHGQLGMRVGGVTLLPPKKNGCTVAGFSDGSLRVATWAKLESSAEDALFWRQGPPCMVEDGKLHPGLASETSRSWGSAVDGDTVIRRSALGLSADGATIFVGVTNHTTARALALGMQHVGAVDVVQLDVNWSYPHVVVFRRAAGGPQPALLFEGFVYQKNGYVARGSERDYFYVTRRARVAE